MLNNNSKKQKKCPAQKPAPPCNEGFIEKEKNYKDGSKSVCCYKDKSNKKKIIIKKNIDLKKNNINLSKKRACPKQKPVPPCNEGFVEKEKIYKDGSKSVCCYKNTKKSNQIIKNDITNNEMIKNKAKINKYFKKLEKAH